LTVALDWDGKTGIVFDPAATLTSARGTPMILTDNNDIEETS
jgi:hypothetical protein